MSSRQIEAGRAIVLIGLENQGFNTGIADLSKKLKAIGRSAMQVGAMMAAAGGGMFAGFAGLTKVVADIETSSRRFDLIFGESAAAMRAELEKLSSKTGVAMTSLEQQASTFGAVFADIRAGVGESNFVDVVAKTQEVMLDLAAIGGISIPEAAERLKSAFTSTGESVDQYGFNLRKANLEAEAARHGIKQSILTMSEQQKQLLKLSIFMRTTQVTGVKFVDMVDTLNGQFTLLRANLLELVVKFGSLISHAFVPVLRVINKLVIAMRPVALILSPLAVTLGPIAAALLTTAAALMTVGAAANFMAWSLGGLKQIRRFVKRIAWAVGVAKVSGKELLTKVVPLFVRARAAILSFFTVRNFRASVFAWRWAVAAIGEVLAKFVALYTNTLRGIMLGTVFDVAMAWSWLTANIATATTAIKAFLAAFYASHMRKIMLSAVFHIAMAWTWLAETIAAATVALRVHLATMSAYIVRGLAATGVLKVMSAAWGYLAGSISAASVALSAFIAKIVPAIGMMFRLLGAVERVIAVVATVHASGKVGRWWSAHAPEPAPESGLAKARNWNDNTFGMLGINALAPIDQLRALGKWTGLIETTERASSLEGVSTAHAFRGDIGRQLAAPSGSTAADRTANGVEDLRDFFKEVMDRGAGAVRTI